MLSIAVMVAMAVLAAAPQAPAAPLACPPPPPRRESSIGVTQQDEGAHRAAWPATIAQLAASYATPLTAGMRVPDLVFLNGAACVMFAAMQLDGEATLRSRQGREASRAAARAILSASTEFPAGQKRNNAPLRAAWLVPEDALRARTALGGAAGGAHRASAKSRCTGPSGSVRAASRGPSARSAAAGSCPSARTPPREAAAGRARPRNQRRQRRPSPRATPANSPAGPRGGASGSRTGGGSPAPSTVGPCATRAQWRAPAAPAHRRRRRRRWPERQPWPWAIDRAGTAPHTW